MALIEQSFTNVFQQALGANPKVLVFRHEQAQLRRQVEIGLVVGRRGQKDALAFVLPNVLLYRPIALAFPITQIVALIDNDQAVAAICAATAWSLSMRATICVIGKASAIGRYRSTFGRTKASASFCPRRPTTRPISTCLRNCACSCRKTRTLGFAPSAC